jgi:tRNA G10  N-methylase Trm11
MLMDELKSLVILGRQPALGLAELESLHGGAAVVPIGAEVAALTLDVDAIDFERLGGSVKLCRILTRLDTANWGDIERFLVKDTPKHAQMVPEGKLQIGLSAYGFSESAQRIQATGLSVKKAIKKIGRSVRLTPNQEPALSSAQVQHNHLTGPTGWELVLVRDGDYTFLAQTVAIQDIDSYTIRDRDRPKRDTRVGMLPPKLAQIIINLAAAQTVPEGKVVLDPFCGTGVVLQEAELMGFNAYGSDLEPRMIDYSAHNLEWFGQQFARPTVKPEPAILEIGDATRWRWESQVDIVACETFLGKPFTSTPPPALIATTANDCNLIIRKFLQNIHAQIRPGTRLCIAVPAWQIRKNEFKHLPLVDSLEEIGYNQVRFEHVESSALLYYREDQVVARELLVITRV